MMKLPSHKKKAVSYSFCSSISSHRHPKILFYNPFVCKNIGFLSVNNFPESSAAFSILIFDSAGKRTLIIDPHTTYTISFSNLKSLSLFTKAPFITGEYSLQINYYI
ncbi:S-Ena type endospore appendage [Bacillus toyonensis]|uniref:S-Ena type endospore appendage n=1 Tax=Bacillus toyonensis TaxID=155322 RepID=UPI000BFC54D1|nr:S-Ena type endospore appendage [Bacillus toyonensis]PHG57794.1 hypothetical protein COI59_29060 [Bacillus toyonensis]